MEVALFGYGYWGRNIARTLTEIGANLKFICDPDPQSTQKVKAIYPAVKIAHLKKVLQSDVEAVFIATPPQSHFEVAREALLAGKHVFVEKPFTTKIEDAYGLLNISEKKDLVAFVDHLFLYSEPVKKLKKMVDEKQFGEILYITARRINLGLFQHTVDVIWDLAIHDLSIVDYLIGLDITRASTFKKKYGQFPKEAFAHIDLDLKNGTIVSIMVSWLSPVKVREMIIGGMEKMAVYDDTKEMKLQIFDQGVILNKDLSKEDLYQYMVQYKFGDVLQPAIPNKQTLTNSIQHFIDCVKEKKEPLTGRKSILTVTKALEIISHSAS